MRGGEESSATAGLVRELTVSPKVARTQRIGAKIALLSRLAATFKFSNGRRGMRQPWAQQMAQGPRVSNLVDLQLERLSTPLHYYFEAGLPCPSRSWPFSS